ncbi:MAG TPA: magnesium transporter CorA family protein [Candidatus Limnocylindrales bacterium]|nr:magnesium transporter CorA family protein [Candidatus Limnocylindrales bacterium]
MIRAAISRSAGAPALPVPFAEAAAAAIAAEDASQVVWVDASACSTEEFALLEKSFGLHPLTVEDLRHRNQRAKLEEFPGYLFLVVHWFRTIEATIKPDEVHCVLGRNWLVTVCDREGVEPIEQAWAGFLRGRVRQPAGADGELYRVLDHLVDSHVPVLTRFEDRLERLSEAVTSNGNHGEIERIVSVRRALVRFRRALAPQRDVLTSLARREHALVNERTLLYFRDVSDHLQREYETIESLRELAQSVMEVELAVSERRQSQVVQRLTVISTIFLPLNFVTGFFGMNFTHMPFDDDRFLLGAMISMVTLPTALVLLFQRRRWI